MAAVITGPDIAISTSTGQIVFTGGAAVALSGHRVVTANPDGTISYADNATAAHRNAPLWLTTAAAAQGDSVTVEAYGQVTEPTWSWTPGPVYLGTNGVLTQTPPVTPALFLAIVGVAISPTVLVVDRQPSISLV